MPDYNRFVALWLLTHCLTSLCLSLLGQEVRIMTASISWGCCEYARNNLHKPVIPRLRKKSTLRKCCVHHTDPVNYVTRVHWPHPDTSSAFEPLLKAASPLPTPTVTTKGLPRKDSNQRIMWICKAPPEAVFTQGSVLLPVLSIWTWLSSERSPSVITASSGLQRTLWLMASCSSSQPLGSGV